MVFFSCQVYKVKKNLVRWGLHLENKFLKLHIHVSELLGPKSLYELLGCQYHVQPTKLHYLNGLLILHIKSINVSTCNRLHTFNWTWQNIHSLELYIIIWCQTMKQIPTVYTKNSFAFTKDCFPYWLIQAANSLVYATFLKKNKSITSRTISWSLIHWQLASFIQCYIK